METKERKYTIEIIKEYCEEYVDMPSKTLARMIEKNHPLDFNSLEGIRSNIRRVRNEHTKFNLPETEHLKRSDQQKQDAIKQKDWHDIPETDYETATL